MNKFYFQLFSLAQGKIVEIEQSFVCVLLSIEQCSIYMKHRIWVTQLWNIVDQFLMDWINNKNAFDEKNAISLGIIYQR